MAKKTVLQVQQAYQNRSDVICLETHDGEIFNLVGNGINHLRVTPPYEEYGGNIRIREGHVHFVNEIHFHFQGGKLDDKTRTTTIVNGITGNSEDSASVTTTPTNNALNYFACTRGGEKMQQLRIPSDDGSDILEYIVDQRTFRIEDRDVSPGEPPTIGIVIDVYCVSAC